MNTRERRRLIQSSANIRAAWIVWHRAAMRVGVPAREAMEVADAMAVFLKAVGKLERGAEVMAEAMSTLRSATPHPAPRRRGRPPRGSDVTEALGLEAAARMRADGKRLQEIVAVLNDRGLHGSSRWNTNTLGKALSRRLKSIR